MRSLYRTSWFWILLLGAPGCWGQEAGQFRWGPELTHRILQHLQRPVQDPALWQAHTRRLQRFLTTSPEKPWGNLAILLDSVPDRRSPARRLETRIYQIGLALGAYYALRLEENPDFASTDPVQVHRLAQFFHYAVDVLQAHASYRQDLIQRLPEELLFKVLGLSRPLFTTSFFRLLGQIQTSSGERGCSIYQAMKDWESQGFLSRDEVRVFLVRCSSYLQVHRIVCSPDERRLLLQDLVRSADARTSVLLGLGIERLMAEVPAEERACLRAALEDSAAQGGFPQLVAECALRYFYESDPVLEQWAQLPARLREKETLSSLWAFDPDGADAARTARYLARTGWQKKPLAVGIRNGSRWRKERVIGFYKQAGPRKVEIALVNGKRVEHLDLRPYDVICLRGHAYQTSVMIRKLRDLHDPLVVNGGCGGYQSLAELMRNHPQAYYIGSGIPTFSQGNDFYMAVLLERLAFSEAATWREVKEGLFVLCAGNTEMERVVENFVVPGTLAMLIYDRQFAQTKRRPGFLQVGRPAVPRLAEVLGWTGKSLEGS